MRTVLSFGAGVALLVLAAVVGAPAAAVFAGGILLTLCAHEALMSFLTKPSIADESAWDLSHDLLGSVPQEQAKQMADARRDYRMGRINLPRYEAALDRILAGKGYVLVADLNAARERIAAPSYITRWTLAGDEVKIDAEQIEGAVQCEDGTWHYQMRWPLANIGPVLREKPVVPAEKVQEAAEMLLNSRGQQSDRQKRAEARKHREELLAYYKAHWP